jgi:peptide methionine sulfoxide reductase msrA/msrB
MKMAFFLILCGVVLLALIWGVYTYITPSSESVAVSQTASQETEQNLEEMLVAGGCFWCVEADMEKLEGVDEVISGYAGGDTENPTYETYAVNGHREVAKVRYNADVVSYGQLLYYLLKHIDPTDGQGQFSDRGEQYAPAIYYQTDEEKQIAEKVLEDVRENGDYDTEFQVPVLKQPKFWKAEEYHQNYYQKNSFQYGLYRKSSGRTFYIQNQWGDKAKELPEYRAYQEDQSSTSESSEKEKPWENFQSPDQETLKQQLSDIQYRVTQQDGTEEPFQNAYWDNEEQGIYVDVVSGEPLFSSKQKFESGTGWPSFSKPLEPENVVETADYAFFIKRTEVRSKHADSHLGHVFEDGPTDPSETKAEEATGLRYCLNSAALEFIPADELEERGYETYTSLFEEDG